MRQGRKNTLLRKGKFKSNLSGWLVMLPGIILFAFFVWFPVIQTMRMSFFNAKGFTLTEFVGLDNYFRLAKHPSFWPAIRNTFVYVFWSLIIGFWVPVIMAVIMTEVAHFKGFFRVGTYFPNIMPGLAMVVVWGYIYRSEGTGVLNIVLGWFGIDPVRWLSIPWLTIPLIILTLTWKSAGSTALIYIAGVSNISPELYEAATIDGAGVWKRIFHITLPSIFSLGKTLLILQIISVFQILYEPLLLTNGGPANASLSIMQQVYNYAFQDFNYPMATALSVLMCLILAVLTVLYFALSKNGEKT